MDVHLLAVAGCPLEADTLWSSVNQDGTIDFSAVLPLGEHIQQARFVSGIQLFRAVCTYVVFPAPELPIRATKFPGLT